MEPFQNCRARAQRHPVLSWGQQRIGLLTLHSIGVNMTPTAAAGRLPSRSQSSRRTSGEGPGPRPSHSSGRPSLNRRGRIENVSRPRDHDTGNRYSENDDVNFLVPGVQYRPWHRFGCGGNNSVWGKPLPWPPWTARWQAPLTCNENWYVLCPAWWQWSWWGSWSFKMTRMSRSAHHSSLWTWKDHHQLKASPGTWPGPAPGQPKSPS